MSMQRLKMEVDTAPAIRLALEVFARGGVVAFPTETVYGIGVKAGDPDAEARLRLCKGRDGDKPFQILIADREQVARFAAPPDSKAQALMDDCWPGPLTLVLPGRHGGTVGLRLPDHPFVRDLARAAGGAIVATSANTAGMPPAQNAEEVEAAALSIDLLLDGGTVRDGVASTVVLYAPQQGTCRILREGGIPRARILSMVPETTEETGAGS